ncbi:MAG: DUF3971 domain-containing protein, partial [Gammaproteobacteria bacterium]|nr:DUF3971 domain-containing protein [Gammaproteobacteria bacterium]
MPGKLIRTLYHFCWYSLAAVIILAAVSITLLRMALPDIGIYREDIQVWISDYMGYPVEIHDINADWEGWIPNLYLDDIRVINERTGQPLISFDQASVTLDLVSSIRRREFIPHRIRVSGLDLSLVRFADGSVSLIRAGEDAHTVPEKSRKNELGQWFRKQKRIEINNVSVNWLDLQKDLHPVRFTNASIMIHSDGDRMQVTGSASTDQHHEPAKFEYALDIHGHMHTTDWSGQIYITADRIDPGYWSDYFRLDKVRFGNTPGKIELWSEWKQAKLVRLDGQVDYNKLDIQDYLFEHIVGEVRLSRNRNDDWLVNLNLQEFTTPEGSWPGITAEIDIPSDNLTMERRLQAHISYVKLDDVYNLLGNSEILDRFGLTNYSIGGELNELNLITDLAADGENFWIDTGVNHLVLNDENGLQVSGISGHLSAENGKGLFYLNSDKAEFGLTGYYDQPLWFYNARGTIDWKTDGDKINIRTDAIRANTSDFRFNLLTTVEIHRDGEPYLDLLANISPVRVESILDYLPQSGTEEIGEWMKNSILGGRLLKTDIVLRGPVSAFPFSNNEGLFQLITQIENSTLEYDPEWPPIDN